MYRYTRNNNQISEILTALQTENQIAFGESTDEPNLEFLENEIFNLSLEHVDLAHLHHEMRKMANCNKSIMDEIMKWRISLLDLKKLVDGLGNSSSYLEDEPDFARNEALFLTSSPIMPNENALMCDRISESDNSETDSSSASNSKSALPNSEDENPSDFPSDSGPDDVSEESETDKDSEESEPEEPVPIFGEFSDVNNLSFEGLASSQKNGFKHDPNFKEFAGAGELLFSLSKSFLEVKSNSTIISAAKEKKEELFSENAKLFRYAPTSKEWNECGAGCIKILRDQKTHVNRILMRRNLVFTICANHRILPEMQLMPFPPSEDTLIWFASDFDQGKVCQQIFALKFESTEVTSNFKFIVDECKSIAQFLRSRT